ncbi:MAG: glycosyltransferase family 1 protein [Thermodesulfobacteriota bacterium]|nr:glycosyltransferase family 1 protein [Thermodesulfobacteriota bacterium]
MRIGISVQGMIGNRTDGGRRYAIELLNTLVPFVRKLGNQVVVFCSKGDDRIIKKTIQNCHVIPVCPPLEMAFLFKSVRWTLIRSHLWSTRNLEWHAKKTQVDFMHFFGIPDYSYTGYCIVTLHCLQHEYFPEFFESPITRSASYKKMLNRADIIITNSRYTANSIKECFGSEFDNKVITAAPLGGDPRIVIQETDHKKVIKKYNITKPYLIYPASHSKNKNHQRLLEALSILVHKDKLNISVVLTGFDNFPRLEWDIERLNLKKHVVIIGKVSDEDLNILIKYSTCMPFVSLFEGFGLPVVEAMALGTPVVCSKVASLPEVGGSAVLYVDPLSIKDIAEKLKKIILDDSLRTELRQAGKKQAANFTWEKCANDTYKAYEKMKELL